MNPMNPKFKIAINSFLFISAAYLNVSTQADNADADDQVDSDITLMSEQNPDNRLPETLIRED
tara:strand:+ start:1081 stop:1269 length:189 start_codon:yes stop_codon:yes gene_type:complete